MILWDKGNWWQLRRLGGYFRVSARNSTRHCRPGQGEPDGTPTVGRHDVALHESPRARCQNRKRLLRYHQGDFSIIFSLVLLSFDSKPSRLRNSAPRAIFETVPWSVFLSITIRLQIFLKRARYQSEAVLFCLKSLNQRSNLFFSFENKLSLEILKITLVYWFVFFV